MTAQIPEKLLMNGKTLNLCSEPLQHYFALHGEPEFVVNCTALWRGYVGTWEIHDARLFLINIEAEYQDGTPASLAVLFPGQTGRIFANWFSGTLRCPRGRELEYVHMGYDSIYEEDLLLRIEQGNLVGKEVQVNGTAAHNARQGFRPAAFTSFPRNRKLRPETPE